MVDKWDRFESSIRRLHDDFNHWDAEIYNYTGGYDPGTGEIDWTRSLAGEVEAEVTETPSTPEARDVVGPGGQQEDVDADIFIPDNTGITIFEVGDDDSKPTEVEANDNVYVVVEAFDEDNGLIRLTCVES